MASLTTLLSRLSSELLRDPNNRIRPTTTLTYALNTAQSYLQSQFQSMVDDTESIASTVDGTQEYNLPSDFAKLISVQYNDQPLTRTTLEELREIYKTFTQWTPTYYYIRPWVIWLYPIPDAVWTIRLYFSNLLPTITTWQDSSVPSMLDDALLYKAASICYRQVGRWDMASIRDIEFEKEVNKALINLVRDFNLSY